ncbi:MAG: protease modulator HflC [Spirochaetia bacterium]
MKKLITTLVIIAIVLIIFLLLGPFYTIQEGEQAVVLRFGRIVSTTTEAGLKFKTPLVDNVTRYSKKILAWDGEAQRIPTQENQFIWVDSTARWRIEDPVLFYESVTTLEQGFARLDDIIDSSIRTVISQNLLIEAVRNSNVINEIERADVIQQQAETEDVDEEGVRELANLTETVTRYDTIEKGRTALSADIFDRAAEIAPQFGIELIDIVVRQIRYSEDLTESVYQRMIKDRNQIAQAFRSYGEGKKAEWLGRLENEKKSILSRAYDRSEQIKGEADAEATRVYADSYEQDPDFFEFWRSIESYRRLVPSFRKTLTTDMDYFKYLYSQLPQ